MALTKIGSIGINTGIQFAGVTTVSTLNSSNNVLSVGGTVNFTGNVSIAGTLTYEDVTNVDSVGIITARSDVLVGSGITLSPDGDIFFTGIMTGNGSGLTGVANTDVIFTDKLQVGDSPELISVGVGSDLQIYHESNNNYINATNGTLFVRGSDLILEDAGGNDYVVCTDTGTGGSVTLKHEGSTKLVTASGGVTVTGTVAATSYTGDGSSLTGIAAGITTTSAQVSGITTVIDLDKDDIRLDCTGLVTIDTKGGSEGNSHTLRIVNSGISTVSFNSYFKFPSGGTPNLPTASGAISLISFTVHTQGRVGVASVFLAGASVNFS